MTLSKNQCFFITILPMLILIPVISVTPSSALTVAPTALEINVDQSKTAAISDSANGDISYVRSHGDDDDSTTLDIGSPGTNRLVVVIAGDENTGTNLSAVTVDGKSCTLVTRADNPDGNHLEMWYIDEDGLGSSDGTETVAISGGDSGWAVHAHLYTGVDQSGPTDFEIDDESTGISTVTVNEIDIPANGLVVMGAGQGRDNKTATWTSPLVERIDRNDWDPQSAGLADASAVVSTQQTNKTYVCTWSTSDFGRGTGIAAVWPAAGGGSGPYSISSSNESAATATLSGNTVTVIGQGVTGGGPDSAVITITDDDSGNEVAITVTVIPPLAATPQYPYLMETESVDITISGGKAPYTLVSNDNQAVATAVLSGSTLTVTGVACCDYANIRIKDDAVTTNYITILANVGASVGASGIGQCPEPPFVKTVEPNILLILDHSGSMRHPPDGGGAIKWDIAKDVLNDLLTNFSGPRFGLMRMDGSDYDGRDDYVGDNIVTQKGKVLRPCGTPNDEIRTYISGLNDANSPFGTQTTLAETLASAGQYFATVLENGNRTGKGPAGFGHYVKNYHYVDDGTQYDATTTDDFGITINTLSPIQFYCQKSFVVYLTDGISLYDNDWDLVTDFIGDYHDDNSDGSPDAADCKHGSCTDPPIDLDEGEDMGTEYFDDVAKYLYEHDMRSDLDETQNITTYVIAFDIEGNFMAAAAQNGGGQYFSAANAGELTTALKNSVIDILNKVASGTAVSTISTSAENADYLIKARFITESWKGYLEAFTLPYSDGDPPDWEAGAQLAARSHTERHIYTYMSSQAPRKQEFVSTLNTDLSTQWGVTDSEAGDIIDYIRGSSNHEGGKYRNRDGWKLGDIIYSNPVTVGPPKRHYTENDYQTFRAANQDRTTMIYVGANDGMLHAFRALDDPAADCDGADAGTDRCGGSEHWAFIPQNVQSKLKNLTQEDCHNYYVDLTLLPMDIYDGSNWKTVLIGGNRLGGDEYFSLDVTDPAYDSFSILWDTIPFPGFKSSTSPVVGKVQYYDDGTGTVVEKWVAIITSGYYDDTDNKEVGKIAALNFTDGTKEPIWDNVDPYLPTRTRSAANSYYTLSSPAAVDSDDDGYLDLIYAGDTEGILWKFYYDYAAKKWKGVPLFDTGGQPITAKPVVAFDDTGKLRLYFGTGKYLINGDKSGSTPNALYCLIEDKVVTTDANNGHYTGTTPISKADDLLELTNVTTQADFNILSPDDRTKVFENGWYIQLDAPGGPAERVLEEAMVLAGVVFFTSYTPDPDECVYEGSARLYAVDFITSLQAMGKDGAPVLDNVTADPRSNLSLRISRPYIREAVYFQDIG